MGPTIAGIVEQSVLSRLIRPDSLVRNIGHFELHISHAAFENTMREEGTLNPLLNAIDAEASLVGNGQPWTHLQVRVSALRSATVFVFSR